MPDVSPTSKLLAPLIGSTYPHPQPTYVLLQNGMGVEKDLYANLLSAMSTPPRIITCAVFVTAQADGNVINNNGMAVSPLRMTFSCYLHQIDNL